VSEALEDEVEGHLPESRGYVILDCELLESRGNEGVEDADEEEVMQVGQPDVR
jgi:hypothetical protein